MSHRIPAVNKRLQKVQTPIISEIANLIQANKGTISLGQGVVYYPPPKAALDCLHEFGSNFDDHIYTHVSGIDELQTMISKKLKQDNNINVSDASGIMVTAGSNMAFLQALFAITSPNDEIVLLRPYYFNHEMAINMLGCKCVAVDCDKNFQPVYQNIINAISGKTRAIVTISPNNPSGAVYSEATLTSINQLCKEKGIYHISDEAYEYFTYNDAGHFSVASLPDSESHTISLFSLSKSYGFASWRIGYAVYPSNLDQDMKKVQDTNLICANRISQVAAVAALSVGKEYCVEKIQRIIEARHYLGNALLELDNICSLPKAEGAFYFLVKCNTELTSLTLAKNLIEQHRIAVLPGAAFGLKDDCYLRVAYGALDINNIKQATHRLINGLKDIIK